MSKLISRIEAAMMAVAVLCVGALMLVVSYDALARYFLGAPLQWAFDFVTFYLMVMLTYFALSTTFQRGDHIGVDLLVPMMNRRFRAATAAVTGVMAAALFAAIACGNILKTVTAYRANEFIPGYFSWPVWLSYLPIALGALVIIVRLLNHAYSMIRYGEDTTVASHGDIGE